MPLIDTGERIRALRKQRGLNQDQLAELASLNRVTVAKYEAGRVEPGAQALVRIADALEVSTDTLLGRSDEICEPKNIPKTEEAWILAKGVDRLPEEERKKTLAVVQAMFNQYQDYFRREDDDGA